MKKKSDSQKEFGYKLMRPFVTIKFKNKYHPVVFGKENIPEKGGIVVCGNHRHVDDQYNALIATKRVVHMLAKDEYFKGKKEWFYRMAGCIPVDRSIHDENAKSEAIEVLKNNEVIGIFPEGTVNRTNDIILPFKYGAVSFAKKTGAYIVPFTITGKYKLFRRSIKITYGKPYKVTDDLEIENKKLMNIITKMLIKERSNVKRKR